MRNTIHGIVWEVPSTKKEFFRDHYFCAKGYYVNTVGLDEDKVRKYIHDQEANKSVEKKPELKSIYDY